MKDKKLKLGLWGLMIFSFSVLRGQDPQFSQFYNSSLYYNPATAGISRDLRFSSSYRKLWSKIPGDLSTYFVSVDYQWAEKNSGIGVLMLYDVEGFQHKRTNRIELVYSYRIQSRDKMLQLGLSLISINFRNFKTNDLIFTDQLDLINRSIRQTSTFVNDNLEPVIYPDWNTGLVYKQNFSRFTPTIDVSVSHIFRPNISFVNNIVRLPVKYVVNASLLTQVTFNNRKPSEGLVANLNPGLAYEYQKPFQTFTIGSDFKVYPFRLGLWFRNRNYFSDDIYRFNSLIVHAGIVVPISSYNNLIIDYTYDSTVSKLEFASGGAHEITLIYKISFPEKIRAVECFNDRWIDTESKARNKE